MAARTTEQLTLYSAKDSQFGQRAEIALEEVKAEYQRYEFDYDNRPVWFKSELSPHNKIPALTYGGTKVDPASPPSADSAKISESLVVLEFIADIYPQSELMPADPVAKAHIRFMMDYASNHLWPKTEDFQMAKSETAEADFIGALEFFQSRLKGDFVAGDKFTLADCAMAPFLVRIVTLLKGDLGKFAVGDGKKLFELISTDAKYAKLWQYYLRVSKRASVAKTYDEEIHHKMYASWFPRK